MHADVVVVGGGYAGLWTAWAVAEAEPDARVVVLEATTCGAGPSGRNAGFLNGFWHRSHLLCEHFGDAAARDICLRAAESVGAIGAWAEDEGIDISYRRDGHLKVATSAAQDGAWDEAVAACARMGFPDECAELDAAAVRRRCASPLFRGGIWMPGGATVQPARLALGLRSALIARGVAIFERTRARRLGPRAGGGVVVETDAGARVSAPAAVLAINQATGAIRPLRSRLAVSATHMIVTEPVPDVLAELGWTGGEAISTARRYLYYFRTTADGRIAFGGAGRLAYGARFGGRVELDPAAVLELRAEIARMFPALADRRIDAAWGGPVDVSPIHIPIIGSLARGPRPLRVRVHRQRRRPRAPERPDPRRPRARPADRPHPVGAGRGRPAAGAARAAALPGRQRRAAPPCCAARPGRTGGGPEGCSASSRSRCRAGSASTCEPADAIVETSFRHNRPAMGRDGQSVIEKAARVLDCYIESGESSLGYAELLEATEINRASLHRTLGEMAEHGILVQDGQRERYRLGPLLRSAAALAAVAGVPGAARPHLTRLRDECRETVVLAELHDTHVVPVLRVDGLYEIRMNQEVGRRYPAHAGATGKVLIANLPDDERRDLLAGWSSTG